MEENIKNGTPFSVAKISRSSLNLTPLAGFTRRTSLVPSGIAFGLKRPGNIKSSYCQVSYIYVRHAYVCKYVIVTDIKAFIATVVFIFHTGGVGERGPPAGCPSAARLALTPAPAQQHMCKSGHCTSPLAVLLHTHAYILLHSPVTERVGGHQRPLGRSDGALRVRADGMMVRTSSHAVNLDSEAACLSDRV